VSISFECCFLYAANVPFWTCTDKLQYLAPAQNVIRYKNVVFSPSFKPHLTRYQGPPSPETDDAWRELYNCKRAGPGCDELQFLTQTTDPISRIDRKDASKIANRTVPIPGDSDHYAVSIDVFHQLHCLVLHPTPVLYQDTNTGRQSSKCSAKEPGMPKATSSTAR